jgi:ADP-ribose pyrophosphatase YjhB (NUDIX family)
MGEIEVIARGLLMERGRVLMCRSVAGGYYYLPGGHVEFGEAAAAAVAREVAEECGLAVRVGECLLVTEVVFRAKRTHHEVSLVFHVQPSGPVGEVASREPEIGFAWIDLAAVIDLDVRPESIKAWLVAGARPGCVFVSEVPRETTPGAGPHPRGER